MSVKKILFNIKGMKIIKKDVLSLSEYDKRKLRTFEGVKTNKQLIKKLKEQGVNLFKKPETQLKRAFEYVINKFNKEAKQEKNYSNFDKKLIKDIKSEKNNLSFVNLDNKKKNLIADRLSQTKNKYILSINNDTFYTLNESVLSILKNDNSNITESRNTLSQSDTEIIDYIIETKNIKLQLVTKKERKLIGSFFKYEHLIPDLDLSELQIYKYFNIENYTENCFIKSLMGQVPDMIINDIRLIIKNKNTTLSSIKLIAEKHNLKIRVKLIDKTIRTYGNNDNNIITLCLVDDHYFKFMTVPITSYALENYKDICHLDNWNEIYKKRNDSYYRKDKKRFIDSFYLVRFLLENKDKYLKPIEKNNLLDSTAYFSSIKEIKNLNYSEESNLKLNEYKEKDFIPRCLYTKNREPFININNPILKLCCKIEVEQNNSGKIITDKMINNFYDKFISNAIKYDCININNELDIHKYAKHNDYINVFFDFETYTNGNKHIPYLCCVKSDNYEKSFFGNDCGRLMLDTLHKDFKAEPIKLIAHNISYDLKFIFKYLSRPSFIKRGSLVMFGNADYWSNGKKQLIKFQDSYSLISSKLSKFGEMFGFQQEKEFIPYCLYTNDREPFINISNPLLKLCCKIQVEQNNIGKNITDEMINKFYDKFISNAKEWNCINNNDELDIYKYAEAYCKIDCVILEKGYNTFKEQIKDAFDMNLENYVSAAAFANDVLLKKGAYDGVYMLNGVVREFIQLCMVGGRTMCSDNKKHIVDKIGTRLSDFDAVSLYPSAMSRLGGYLKGKPKILKTTNYEDIKNYDGYFVEVKIIKVNKKLSFPLLSYTNKDGIRNFTNEMEGRTVYLDKISLEDAIQFQKIEFEIIKGYYYNEGRNFKLKEIIKFLFEERLRLKKKENPLQNIYKLIMNSSYGKTLLKPIDENVSYIKGTDKMMNYIINNYTFHKITTLVSEIDIEDKYKVYEVKTIKPINNHFNNASCGVEVLSMSKRIMNEVMCLANDLELKLYYQDTDSMHISENDINILSNAYKSKYNRDLIGKNMGQFHTDFSSKILDKETIYAKRSIFLGKKCYIDELSDKNGDIDYHIRMKGISEDSIKYHAYLDFNNDPYLLFEYLYHGNSYTFDLTCNNLKCCFESVNMNTIRSREAFNRQIIFTDKEKKEIKKLKKMSPKIDPNMFDFLKSFQFMFD